MVKLKKLISDAKGLLAQGVWAPEDMYKSLSSKNRYVHYATIRKAIHIAKSEIYS